MAENESMEGKDLAKEEKQSFRERLKVQITKLKNDKTAKETQNEEQEKRPEGGRTPGEQAKDPRRG